MRAGPLDRRITIEVRTVTQNDAGAPVESWAEFATVWAQKTDLRGDEFFAAQKENGEITTRFRIRHFAGLKAEMRIAYDGLYYDIVQLMELGRRDGWEILARAWVE